MTTKDLATKEERLYTAAELQDTVGKAIAFALKQGVPTHRHVCTEGHEWFCTSSYCEDVATAPRTCVEHGGDKPIQKGFEPWKGGQR